MSKSYNYDWKELLEEQQASGMNMKKFCREKNLPYQSFKNHKRTIQAPNPGSALFLPVKQEATKNVEFRINGNLISFDASLDDEYVSRILKALMAKFPSFRITFHLVPLMMHSIFSVIGFAIN